MIAESVSPSLAPPVIPASSSRSVRLSVNSGSKSSSMKKGIVALETPGGNVMRPPSGV